MKKDAYSIRELALEDLARVIRSRNKWLKSTKRCPFCGGFGSRSSRDGLWYVLCPTCGGDKRVPKCDN